MKKCVFLSTAHQKLKFMYQCENRDDGAFRWEKVTLENDNDIISIFVRPFKAVYTSIIKRNQLAAIGMQCYVGNK